MGLKFRKNFYLLSLLFIFVIFSLKLLLYSTENQQSSYSFFNKNGGRRASSFLTAADNVNELTNLSSTFQSQFCDYHIHPLRDKPLICLFRKEDDIYVSAAVMKGSLWDIEGVSTVLKHMLWMRSNKQEVILVDLGANIGTFTIPALAYGFETIAVEPMKSTMTRLATSIYLNNFSKLAKVHLKAISDRRGCVRARENKENKGGSEVDLAACTSEGDLRAITLDDVIQDMYKIEKQNNVSIVLKIDVQRFEPYGIKGGMKILRSGKVKLIYMEWAEMGKVYSKDFDQTANEEMRSYKKLVEECMTFLLFEMKYEVYSHEGRPLKWTIDKSGWTNNIFLALPGFWQQHATSIPLNTKPGKKAKFVNLSNLNYVY